MRFAGCYTVLGRVCSLVEADRLIPCPASASHPPAKYPPLARKIVLVQCEVAPTDTLASLGDALDERLGGGWQFSSCARFGLVVRGPRDCGRSKGAS
jgi:hypothetical protein